MRGCDRCGAPLNSGEAFCMSCGAPQPSISDGDRRHDMSEGDLGLSQRNPVEAPPAKHGLFKRLLRRLEGAPANSVPVPSQELPPFGGSSALSSGVPRSVCPSCGIERNDPTDRFCAFCGFRFPEYNDGQAEEDETTVFDGVDGGFADEDESTTVLDEELYCYFVRDVTGERIVVNLPALVGKGSAASCRIAGNNGISRVHAEIFVREGVLMIKDRGSTNGTFVNGERLRPNRELCLRDGDAVLLANEAFTFHVEGI